jgi:hypothetical protein
MKAPAIAPRTAPVVAGGWNIGDWAELTLTKARERVARIVFMSSTETIAAGAFFN